MSVETTANESSCVVCACPVHAAVEVQWHWISPKECPGLQFKQKIQFDVVFNKRAQSTNSKAFMSQVVLGGHCGVCVCYSYHE